MSNELLQIQGLKKQFVIGNSGILHRRPVTLKAVDGISFSVKEGETFGLVGESGSGKSTVAYTIVGMYHPTDGRILFKGQNLLEHKGKRSKELVKQIQIVFQDPGSSLNPRRSIQQNLELPLRIHQPEKNPRKEVVRLLEMVELPAEYLYKYPNSLSGGEKQIVAIARALATNPSLVILDEPTSSLDVSSQAKIINILLHLQTQFNLSYLFITHDLSLMRNVASRVAIMYLGKIAEVADTVEFFTKPHHPYTRMLLSAIPVISEEEENLKPKKIMSRGEIPSPVNIPSGCSFRSRCLEVMDVCAKIDPEMTKVGDEGHIVRCHLFQDLI